MTVYECSLKIDTPQLMAPARFHIVRFPFGTAEPLDEYKMHQMAQPDGHQVADWRTEDRAGLIWPAVDGWGVLSGMVRWEPGNYRETSTRFVRDPLGLSTGWDATATDERAPTPGTQRAITMWQMRVHPGTPIALQVCHDDTAPRRLLLAEFKLAIHPREGA
jgi:hypothetical protein